MPATGDTVKVVVNKKTITDSEDSAVMYLIDFESKKSGSIKSGFVLVAADKRTRPILAKSESGSINLYAGNPGLKIWLDYVKNSIGQAKRHMTNHQKDGSLMESIFNW